jgi:hypothetical protein
LGSKIAGKNLTVFLKSNTWEEPKITSSTGACPYELVACFALNEAWVMGRKHFYWWHHDWFTEVSLWKHHSKEMGKSMNKPKRQDDIICIHKKSIDI